MFVWSHGNLLVIKALVSYPDITIFSDGLETSYFGIKRFIEWKDIRNLHQWELGYKIWYRKTPLGWRLITLDSPLMMTKWCNNYEKAIAIIEDNV
jgi:hypothetical protein